MDEFDATEFERTRVNPFVENESEDPYMELAKLQKEFPKYQLNTALNAYMTDDQRRKLKILEKLRKKKIKL